VLQSTEKTVEREVVFWYLIGDGDLDFEVVHWATPPRFLVEIEVRCSPFFILRQRLSRNFGTSSNIEWDDIDFEARKLTVRAKRRVMKKDLFPSIIPYMPFSAVRRGNSIGSSLRLMARRLIFTRLRRGSGTS
jgi:hypothetical protein